MATIYDVARAAGVSPKTVSRVLNSAGLVSQATRGAVEAAIRDLGYVPSTAARSMRGGRSGLVGLLTGAISVETDDPERTGLPEIQIVQGIQEALREAGYTLLIADTGGRVDGATDLMRTFAEHRVEGLIHVAPHHQRVPDLPAGPPTVIANGFDAVGTASVVPDDYIGQRALTDRLIAEGHRRIAYLTLRAELVATQERTRGYLDALTDAGIAFAPALVRQADMDAPDSRERMAVALDALLALEPRPTVICAGNDCLALQLYGMLRARGLRIPQDMSIAGYDDHRLISETLYPGLTTVRLPYRRMGRAAAQLFLEGAPQGPPVRVAGELRWRGSVAAYQT
ncbi:MAG: LacI family DNA-binding transcriptional regulator [Pseudomonadota bacterium]